MAICKSVYCKNKSRSFNSVYIYRPRMNPMDGNMDDGGMFPMDFPGGPGGIPMNMFPPEMAGGPMGMPFFNPNMQGVPMGFDGPDFRGGGGSGNSGSGGGGSGGGNSGRSMRGGRSQMSRNQNSSSSNSHNSHGGSGNSSSNWRDNDSDHRSDS